MPQKEVLEVQKRKSQLQIGIPQETCLQEKRVVLTPDAVQLLTEDNGEESLGDRTDSDPDAGVRIKRTDQSLPFGLLIDEEQVTVYCLDDEMVARALIHTDDADACRWGSYTFKRYWSGGDLHPPYTDRMSY